ncbi:MAG: hypothetical protein ACTHMM_04845 [Agriterribacter sp.]
MNKKYLLSTAVLVFAIIGFLAFKPASKVATPTWYQYTGAQTPADRIIKSNYVKVGTGAPTCLSGTTDECAVQLKDDFGPDASSANITFDGSTGMPLVTPGTDVNSNRTKRP